MSNVVYLPARRMGKTARYHARIGFGRAQLARWTAEVAEAAMIGLITNQRATELFDLIERQLDRLDAMGSTSGRSAAR